MSEQKLRIGFPSSQLVLIVMGILVLYLALDFGRQVIVSQQQQGKLDEVQAQMNASTERQAALQAQLDYAKSPAAAEAWAREQGWVKGNEVPVVIVSPKLDVPAAPNAAEGDASSGTVLDEWWKLFFGSR